MDTKERVSTFPNNFCAVSSETDVNKLLDGWGNRIAHKWWTVRGKFVMTSPNICRIIITSVQPFTRRVATLLEYESVVITKDFNVST